MIFSAARSACDARPGSAICRTPVVFSKFPTKLAQKGYCGATMHPRGGGGQMRHRSCGAGVGYRARLVSREKGRIVAAVATVVAALAGTSMAGVPAASAGTSETVIVTATGLLSPAAAVLEVG